MPAANKTEKDIPQEDSEVPDLPNPSPEYTVPDPSEESIVDPSEEAVIHDKKGIESPGEERDWQFPAQRGALSGSEERTWAMLAHLSVLLNLVTGFLGGIAAIIIYFVYKDRSRLVAYHAMQSFIFQCITWLAAGFIATALITLGTALAFLIIPLLCLVPGFLVLLLIPGSLIYGIIGAVQVNNGEDFRYWQVGDWVRDILEPKPIPKA